MPDLTQRLRAVDVSSDHECYMSAPLFAEAADALDALEAEIARILSAIAPPLKWETVERSNDMGYYNQTGAKTPFGYIWIKDMRPFLGADAGFCFIYGDEDLGRGYVKFPTKDEAMRGAEADYAARLRAALAGKE